MIELKGVSLSRGKKQLLNAADLNIHPGEKVGLIGSNGSGKSSLLSLLRGELKEEAGEVFLSKHWRISSVAQELEQSDTTALDFVLSGDEQWTQVQADLLVAEAAQDAQAIGDLHEILASIDGYSAPARAAELLHGLGFSPHQQGAATASFSGGWQMRLNLARALMKPCELMLLDEPTNHLDLDAIVWLERWLQYFPGTLIIISHDSIFLDKVINKVVWLDQRHFTAHKGNYTDFLKWRAEKLQHQQKSFEKQQQKRQHLQSFVDRFRATASKASQAQSRLKMLAKMEVIARVQTQSSFQFDLPAADNCPNPVLQFKGADLGYGNKRILKNLDMHLGPKDRIGLLGANGAGKSTLMKTLSGQLPLLSGEYTQSPRLKIGYFAQHQVDLLHVEHTAMWHLEQQAPGIAPGVLRGFLGRFGFAGDMAFTKIEVFSGGEKARLVLCLLSWKKPHLLILDEPTNHLDLEMREALALALQEFDGAVVLVSHDRQLLGSVVDQFWLVAQGGIQSYDGDLDSYADWLLKERKKEEKLLAERAERSEKMEKTRAVSSLDPAVENLEYSGGSPAPRVEAKPKINRLKLSKLEEKIQGLQRALGEINGAFLDPTLYEPSGVARCVELNRQKDALERELAQREAEWLALMA